MLELIQQLGRNWAQLQQQLYLHTSSLYVLGICIRRINGIVRWIISQRLDSLEILNLVKEILLKC